MAARCARCASASTARPRRGSPADTPEVFGRPIRSPIDFCRSTRRPRCFPAFALDEFVQSLVIRYDPDRWHCGRPSSSMSSASRQRVAVRRLRQVAFIGCRAGCHQSISHLAGEVRHEFEHGIAEVEINTLVDQLSQPVKGSLIRTTAGQRQLQVADFPKARSASIRHLFPTSERFVDFGHDRFTIICRTGVNEKQCCSRISSALWFAAIGASSYAGSKPSRLVVPTKH